MVQRRDYILALNLFKVIDRSALGFACGASEICSPRAFPVSFSKQSMTTDDTPDLEEGTGVEDTAFDIEPEAPEPPPQPQDSEKIPNCKVRLQLDAEWWTTRDGLKVSPNKFVSLQVALMGLTEPRKYFFEHPDLRKEYPDLPVKPRRLHIHLLNQLGKVQMVSSKY